jgi:hypothetical protein
VHCFGSSAAPNFEGITRPIDELHLEVEESGVKEEDDSATSRLLLELLTSDFDID